MAVELKNIWEVCEFEDDVKYGRLEPARFAVELYDVIDGKTDKVYTDPHLFLTHTYLSWGMRYLLGEALKVTADTRKCKKYGYSQIRAQIGSVGSFIMRPIIVMALVVLFWWLSQKEV